MTGISFSFDPDWMYTLSAPFMTNAFLAGLCISLAAGVMGYFTIARHSTFAAHALAHIGLPGATGAVLLGLPVSLGMGVFALGGALVIGALGKRATQREIATGTVLAFATGLGLFFARLSSSASQQMQSILFGSILTITTDQILGFAVFDVILLAVLAIVYRPLLFSSLDEQVAQAKGVPIGLMNVAFMAIMAGVITIAVPAVGTLLIFALVITPGRHGERHRRLAVQGDGDRNGAVPGVDLGRSGAVRDVPRSPELHHRHVVDAVLGDRQGRDVGCLIADSARLHHQRIGDGGDSLAPAGESHMVGGRGGHRHPASDGIRQRALGFLPASPDLRTIADDDHAGAGWHPSMRSQYIDGSSQHIAAVHAGSRSIGSHAEQSADVSQPSGGQQRIDQGVGGHIAVRIPLDTDAIP